MLRKTIERATGALTDDEFKETLDLADVDIKVNRYLYGSRTSLAEVIRIVVICLNVMRRGEVA